MKQFLGQLLLLVGVLANGEEPSKVTATPLTKVLEMLDTMLGTCKEEKKTEEVEFSKFSQWCASTRKGYKTSISEAAAKIEQLEADITKATADAAEHGAVADEHNAKSDAAEKDLANATAIRKQENTDFLGTKSDFEGAIDAIERAHSTLMSRSADVPQSLAQVKTSIQHFVRGGVSPSGKRAVSEIDALLALGSQQTPKANAYEFQSSSVTDMLKKMRLKFQDEKLALEKAELSNRNNYEVLAQKLTGTIKESKSIAAEKTSAKAQRLDDAAASKGELEITEKAKAEDEKALDDLNSECHAASDEYEKNQVTRTDEIKAIEKACEILRSDDVSGNAETYLPTALAQRGSFVSLVQVSRSPNSGMSDAVRSRVSELLQSRAKSLGSRYLSLAASRVAEDPFAKVKKMIADMIVKLMEEANAEADKKAFCDAELATNKQTRETKQAEVDELTARVEKLTSESEQLVTELTELNDAVVELKGRQAEATTLRQEEKKTNAQTVADAKASQVAVERAVQVLKDFYAKESSSFVQEVAKAPYTGMKTESGNVLAFLEVILSDFARLETETASAEDSAAEEYQTFMDESTENLAVKATEISHKEASKREADSTAAKLSKELDLTQEELDAALTYYDKLKADCITTGLSYEDRVQKREEEIQSLKEALSILNQEAV
jgi:hypothetical protein